MPKGEIAKIPVNKEIFIAVLNAKGYSIRKFSEEHGEICSDRTLRRALNAHQIQNKYVDDIAKLLDVDPRFLTGEISRIDPKMSRVKNIPMQYYLAQINNYPYSRKELDDLQKTAIEDHLKNILSLFEFSYDQFENLEFEKQYNFQHDLFESIANVLAKYFKEDGYGNKERPALDTLILSLEGYYEDECELRCADTIIREKFIQSPPKGYTADKIRTMTREEILDLDMYLQWKDYEPSEEDFEMERQLHSRHFKD